MKIFYCVLVILISMLLGYLFGAIPNSVIIGKIFYKRDPRLEGSKNPGGTNSARVFGIYTGLIVIVLDGLKIILPFLTAYFLYTNVDVFKKILMFSNEINAFGRGNTINQLAYWIVPFFGIIGHCYSIFLHFNGGKAVSSLMGTYITFSWVAWPILIISFFSTYFKTKFVSLSSIISTGVFMIFSWIIYIIFIFQGLNFTNNFTYFGLGPEICIYAPLFFTFSYLLLIIRHKSNIKRLLNKSENQFIITKKKII